MKFERSPGGLSEEEEAQLLEQFAPSDDKGKLTNRAGARQAALNIMMGSPSHPGVGGPVEPEGVE